MCLKGDDEFGFNEICKQKSPERGFFCFCSSNFYLVKNCIDEVD